MSLFSRTARPVLGLLLGSACAAALAQSSLPSSPPSAITSAPTPAASAQRYGLPQLADLVEQVGPAVVNITVSRTRSSAGTGEGGLSPDDPFFDFLRRFGIPHPAVPSPGQPRTTRGIGSGFIISADGYVLTNAHVIGERDAEVTVRLGDKRDFKASVVGMDSRTDVAVLKIDASGLPSARIGDPNRARVGDWVLAMGSPFGFEHTVTAGIVSAKARRLPSETYVPFLQTDVAINPGNSGGPLFNLDGEVIGINSQIYSRSGGFMGISFAIPIDAALTVKDQLVQFGHVQRGKLGVTIQAVNNELAQNFGLANAAGALVSRVDPDSAAARAGIKVGDIILRVDDTAIDDSTGLPRVIAEKRPGTTVQLHVWRDGAEQSFPATLDAMPQTLDANATPGSNDLGGTLGLSGRSLTSAEATERSVEGGVLVEDVSGIAAESGLRKDDIIIAVNNQTVTSVEHFQSAVAAAGKRFALLLLRDDAQIFVPIRLD